MHPELTYDQSGALDRWNAVLVALEIDPLARSPRSIRRPLLGLMGGRRVALRSVPERGRIPGPLRAAAPKPPRFLRRRVEARDPRVREGLRLLRAAPVRRGTSLRRPGQARG